MKDRRRALPILLLVASAWLAAGPGGVTLLAAAACRHHGESHASHASHSGAPTNAPCYCDHMTGGSDVTLAPAHASVAAVPVLHPGPLVEVSFPLPASPVPGFVRSPIPPPPNPQA
jgi:hypothetical protein